MRIFKRLLFTVFFCSALAASAQDDQAVDDTDTSAYEETDNEEEYDEYTEEAWTEETGYEDPNEPKPYFSHYDSSRVELRVFDSATLNRLRQDPELSYGYTQASMSLWDAFWLWLIHQLDGLAYEGDGVISFDTLLVVLFVGVLTYVIIRLMKRGHLKMFYGRGTPKEKKLFVVEENIHEMDFEKLLEEAARNKNYRLAIRLFFLYGLKMLADKQHIYWEPGKTNQEYVNEVQAAGLRKDFSRLNYYFEYAWYGDFTITADLFKQVNTLFVNWKTRI